MEDLPKGMIRKGLVYYLICRLCKTEIEDNGKNKGAFYTIKFVGTAYNYAVLCAACNNKYMDLLYEEHEKKKAEFEKFLDALAEKINK